MIAAGAAGLLIDTNLLVLLAVGLVNRDRIETFKRTRQYSRADYDLLLQVVEGFSPLYTVAHVLAEVSNLTDLSGSERARARDVLKNLISSLNEERISSADAADHTFYSRLGLVDAAVGAVARIHNCTVLTDDLDLYHLLSHEKLKVLNFTHLRAGQWGL